MAVLLDAPPTVRARLMEGPEAQVRERERESCLLYTSDAADE